jgi:hypothetical protein
MDRMTMTHEILTSHTVTNAGMPFILEKHVDYVGEKPALISTPSAVFLNLELSYTSLNEFISTRGEFTMNEGCKYGLTHLAR